MDPNLKLSQFVKLKEVTKSDTAIRAGIDNSPTEEHLEKLKLLCTKVFDPLRSHFNRPIGISSGYRSKALNDAVKGASLTSQHCKGEAIDIDADIFDNITNKELFEYIKDNLDFDQLICEYPNKQGEPSWVHVSYSTKRNRKQVLIAYKLNGKVVYLPYSKENLIIASK
ncbi:MAG TPA: D-Ala-D-Ala carboxypeptidase family metallohydrolase [Candidatus Dojkabacteria bacterium]|nr:D-Ala-D-Ala carboxypeptidase family metallohydrolase [Candidatus Dojkabacteria bacterium]